MNQFDGNTALSSPLPNPLDTQLEPYYHLLESYSADSFGASCWNLSLKRSGDFGRVNFPPGWPDDMRTLAKICVLNYLVEGCTIKTCSAFLHASSTIFDFMHAHHYISFSQLRPGIIDLFVATLSNNDELTNSQRNRCMRAFESLVEAAVNLNLVAYTGVLDLSFRWKDPQLPKRAPDHCVVEQLDKLFFNMNTRIPLEHRCLYMVLRLRANRISEVLSMPLECISYPEEGVFALAIPTQKETPYHEPVYTKYSFLLAGRCESLFFELLKEQQELVRMRQSQISDICKDYFFLSPSSDTIVTVHSFNTFLEHFCNRYTITDAKGRPAKVTSHDFRHIAVCERLSSELITPYQTMVECNHSSLAQTMGYGYPSLHDETQHLAGISQEVFSFQKSEKSSPMVLPETKYDRLLNLPATRILPGHGICINAACTPRFEKCFRCHSFRPNPIYRDYMLAAIDLLEKKNEKLAKKKGTDSAIEKNQSQIELFHQYLEKCENVCAENYTSA